MQGCRAGCLSARLPTPCRSSSSSCRNFSPTGSTTRARWWASGTWAATARSTLPQSGGLSHTLATGRATRTITITLPREGQKDGTFQLLKGFFKSSKDEFNFPLQRLHLFTSLQELYHPVVSSVEQIDILSLLETGCVCFWESNAWWLISSGIHC